MLCIALCVAHLPDTGEHVLPEPHPGRLVLHLPVVTFLLFVNSK